MQPMQTQKTERVVVLMPERDARRLKHAAIDAGRSTSSIVREALGPLLRDAGQSPLKHAQSDE